MTHMCEGPPRREAASRELSALATDDQGIARNTAPAQAEVFRNPRAVREARLWLIRPRVRPGGQACPCRRGKLEGVDPRKIGSAAMIARERLPNRRQCESFEFAHIGLGFALGAGSYPDGRVAEIFLSTHRPGSPIESIARDAAVTVSIALQFGADLATIRAALTKDHDGGPATLLGAALDALVEIAP